MTYVDGPAGGTPLNAANLNRDFNARPAKWAPSTPYIGGTDLCINPSGDLVSCTVSHTSTGSYDASKWALSATFGQSNPTLASMVRDSSGRIQSFTEGGVAASVTRDTTGKVATITTGSTTRTISRDSAGRVSGVA